MAKKNEGPKMNPDDLKLLIEKNKMIQYCLRIMNDLSLNEKDEDYVKDEDLDYMELWNKISLQNKVDAGEVNAGAVAFYFDLLSTGYDNFGVAFFRHMAEGPNAPYLYYAIKCFLDYMSNYTEEAMEEENK